VGSARDVTLKKQTESEIHKRDMLLDAIAKATALLVQGEKLEEGISGALEIIGKATEVNRVYIFRNHEATGFKMPLMSQDYEWTDGLVEPQINNPDLQNVPYEIACPRWFTTLSAGKTIVGNIREFPEPEKTILGTQGIKSILVTPVFIDQRLWGFIGFDDCVRERDWPLTEERILAAAANTIGSAYLRKKNQDELIAAKEKAVESDRLKSAFLANMSHEIRTPMNGILGFITLLQEPDLKEDEKDEYFRIVRKSGDRLLNTLHDIIDISKIESGQMPVITVDFNINELCRNLQAFFKQEAETKGLQLFFNGGLPEREATINTDKDKLQSILSNLIKNAVKYTDQGFAEFGCSSRGEWLTFYVKDTGIGIPVNKRKAIFERFVQADISHSRLYEGSGLGLSISKAYVEMLAGELWVESEDGKGSTFYFQIPCIRTGNEPGIPVPETILPVKAGDNPLTIVVTEDDPVNFNFFNVILKKAGHTVLHAGTGAEALEFCRQTPGIDIILMDIKLPDMDGYEVTQEIRKFNTGIPIIALTAYAFQSDREKSMEAGCNDYLSKPVKKDELLMAIERLRSA
ncbi:MAG: response regulator, partial [Bacteroidota bacterium]